MNSKIIQLTNDYNDFENEIKKGLHLYRSDEELKKEA